MHKIGKPINIDAHNEEAIARKYKHKEIKALQFWQYL